MSSTSNVQNYLSNVFRPKYVVDGGIFKAALEVSNVDTLFANSVSVQKVIVRDSMDSNNMYLGAGNTAAISDSKIRENVVVGVDSGFAVPNSIISSNVVIGNQAGRNIQNVSNSVYIGYKAGNFANGGSGNVVLGSGAGLYSRGINNIFIGINAGTSNAGSNNIIIGANTDIAGTASGQMNISNAYFGDIAAKKFGVGLYPQYNLDVCGSMNVKTASNATLTFDTDTTNVTTLAFTTSTSGNSTNRISLFNQNTRNALRFDVSSSIVMTHAKEDAGGYTRKVYYDSAGVGINKVPTTALDVAGTVTADGYSSLSGNITSTIANTYSVGIGTIKKGLVLVTANTSNIAHSIMYLFRNNAGNDPVEMITKASPSDVASNKLISISNNTTISISNATGSTISNIAWSITYFPTP